MQVIDLIIKLKELPPNKEVVFDWTADDTDYFKLVIISEVSEITTDSGEEYVLLSSPSSFEEIGYSDN